MKATRGGAAGMLAALIPVLGSGLDSGVAQAQTKVAVAGGACLCYLPTVPAKQLGEFDKAGLQVELVDIDLGKTYTNRFVEQAKKTTGMKAN